MINLLYLFAVQLFQRHFVFQNRWVCCLRFCLYPSTVWSCCSIKARAAFFLSKTTWPLWTNRFVGLLSQTQWHLLLWHYFSSPHEGLRWAFPHSTTPLQGFVRNLLRLRVAWVVPKCAKSGVGTGCCSQRQRNFTIIQRFFQVFYKEFLQDNLYRNPYSEFSGNSTCGFPRDSSRKKFCSLPDRLS